MDTENQSIVKSARRSKILVFILAIILLLVALFGVYRWMFLRNANTSPVKVYSVVYLASGEVYVGQLSLYPKMSLSDAYVLQVTQDPKDTSKNNFRLASLKDALWSPDKIYLNKEQVIFYGKVGEGSQIDKTLKQAK